MKDSQSVRGSEIFCGCQSASGTLRNPHIGLIVHYSRDTTKYSINRLYCRNFKYVKLFLISLFAVVKIIEHIIIRVFVQSYSAVQCYLS